MARNPTGPTRLLQIAAEAELLRLKSMATRMATRVGFAVVAALFLIGVGIVLHIWAWHWLRVGAGYSAYATAGILGGVDLVIAIVLGLLASRSRPSQDEREAPQVRREAVQYLKAEIDGYRPLPLFQRVVRRRFSRN